MTNIKELKKEIKTISVARWYDPIVNTCVVLAGFFLLAKGNLSDVEASLLIILLTSLALFFIEFFRAPWKYTDRPKQNFWQLVKNILTKYLGVLFGILIVLYLVSYLPHYLDPKYSVPLFEARYLFLMYFLPISFLLIAFSEYILGEKKDGTYQFGLLVTFRHNLVNWKVFGLGVLEWLARSFFLIINFTSATALFSAFRINPAFLTGNFISDILLLKTFIFAILLFTILPGYSFSSRLIGTDVKKVDTTWFAWVITIICYQPFSEVVFHQLLAYYPQTEMINGLPVWVDLLLFSQVLLYTFAVLILLNELFHLWAESTMGIRASNLTNRGIITTGPFAITKHPVYLSKCFGWALLYIPFFNGENLSQSFFYGLMFLLICGIFIGRSLSEERLLATDVNYVKYALFMDKFAWFAFVGKIFPFMTFEWRYNYWKKKHMLIESD